MIGMPDHLHNASYTRCLAAGLVGSLIDTLEDSQVIDMPGNADVDVLELRVEEACLLLHMIHQYAYIYFTSSEPQWQTSSQL